MTTYYRMPDLWRASYPERPTMSDIVTLATICHLADLRTMEATVSLRTIATTAGLPLTTVRRSLQKLQMAQILAQKTAQKTAHFKVLLSKESAQSGGTQNGTQNGTENGTQYNNIKYNNNNIIISTRTTPLNSFKNAQARARDAHEYEPDENPWQEMELRLRDVMAYCYCTEFEAKRATRAWYRAMKAKGKRYTSPTDARQHCLDWCFKKYFKREEIWALQDHEELTQRHPD